MAKQPRVLLVLAVAVLALLLMPQSVQALATKDTEPLVASSSASASPSSAGGGLSGATPPAAGGASVSTGDKIPAAAAPIRVKDDSPARSGVVASDHDEFVDDLDTGIDIPPSLLEVEDRESGGKRQNYASLDAGATILDVARDTKSATNLLVPDKDRYMLMPCQNPSKWVVVSLSEDVHADAIALANYEKFSSPVKGFLVLGSVTYPTDTWYVLGNFTAAHSNGEQLFPLDSQHHVRYVKLRFFSHYGDEYYCTLSQLKCVSMASGLL